MSWTCCWCDCLVKLVTWLGVFYTGRALYRLGSYIYLMFFCKELELLKRYGAKSWALITGSTDGIGWTFANSLAARGFNILLTGRDKAKLADRSSELKKKFPGVDVDTIQVDFGEEDQVDKFIQTLQNSNKDISILVNNVALFFSSGLGGASPQDLKKAVRVNCIVQSLLLNDFLPRLSQRKLKSAVIDVGSILALSPTSHIPVQAATKTYNTILSAGAYMDTRYQSIDWLCLMPGWTKTNMLKDYFLSVLVATPEQVVEGALRHLGHARESFGSRKHFCNAIIRHVLQEFLPLSWRDKVIGRLEDFLRTIPMQ